MPVFSISGVSSHIVSKNRTVIWGWFFSWCLDYQVTSQVKLAAFKSVCSGYTWLPQPRRLSSGQHTTRYPSTALPSTPQKSLLCVCGCTHGYVFNMCCYVCEQARACVYMDIIVCVYLTVFLQELKLAAITFDGYLLWLWRAVRFPVGDSLGFWQMPVPIYCYCHCSCSPPQVCVCAEVYE